MDSFRCEISFELNQQREICNEADENLDENRAELNVREERGV